jgi:hypothetical protein
MIDVQAMAAQHAQARPINGGGTASWVMLVKKSTK